MNPNKIHPPKNASRFLQWFLKDELLEEVMGDLEEKFFFQLTEKTPLKAKINYWFQVFHYLRPFAIRSTIFSNLNPFFMWRHHLKISSRNLRKNKGYSFINIGGLAIGMAVALLLGLWVQDEISFNKHHENHDQIAHVYQHRKIGDEKVTWMYTPFPLAEELRTSYGNNFKHIVQSSWPQASNLKVNNEDFNKTGVFIQVNGIEMLAPKMIDGNWDGLTQPNSILISKSLAHTLFKNEVAIDKTIQLNNEYDVKVTGVFEDFPANSTYAQNDFFGSWDTYLTANSWIQEATDPWRSNSFQVLVQIADNTTFEQVSENIKDVILKNIAHDTKNLNSKPNTFLLPMKDWYLNAKFVNGVQTGGRIQYVWLFSLIGIFVLLLACINFINLSTARSEKRAKEVGVRKAIGSMRHQLIYQFFSESMLVVLVASIIAICAVQLGLPWFNEIASKQIALKLNEPNFWLSGVTFIFITGILSGSYPALFLSSFKPIEALKGTFKLGVSATLPRKILVITQFTVSIALIIGTIMVYQQIQHGQNRSLGYNQNNLAYAEVRSNDLYNKLEVLENELKKEQIITGISMSTSPPTSIWSTVSVVNWKGKDPNFGAIIPFTGISPNFGKTVGWQIKEGRDFSKEMKSDSLNIVINEAAVEFMGLKNPVGETIQTRDESLKIIGVVNNLLVESPYQEIRPQVFYSSKDGSVVNFKLNPSTSASDANRKITAAIEKHLPGSRAQFAFVDDIFNQKFGSERRIAKLSTFFALLAIFISCLGLFGLASYLVERKNKEISIRKILGASVFNLWSMLSKDFFILVIIASLMAIPIASYFISGWLENFDYKMEIPLWVFAIAGFGALVITLFTVSFQAIKAAMANPVNALKQD